MREADYVLGDALAFLLVLNLGAIAGLLVAGKVADRSGARRAGIAWFTGAVVFLALLSIRLPIGGIYVMKSPAAGAGHGAGLVGRRPSG